MLLTWRRLGDKLISISLIVLNMFCHNCGADVALHSNFCMNCGKSMSIPSHKQFKNEDLLKKICLSRSFLYSVLAVILVIIIGGISWLGVMANERQLLAEQNDSLKSSLDERDSRLNLAAESLQTATEKAKQCEVEKGQTESEKAAAETQAATQKTEAQRQAGLAAQKSKELSGCQYYLTLAAQLADVLDTQKQLYRQSGQYVAASVSDFVNENYYSAQYNIQIAMNLLDRADGYEPQVSSLLAQFQ